VSRSIQWLKPSGEDVPCTARCHVPMFRVVSACFTVSCASYLIKSITRLSDYKKKSLYYDHYMVISGNYLTVIVRRIYRNCS